MILFPVMHRHDLLGCRSARHDERLHDNDGTLSQSCFIGYAFSAEMPARR
jgi:hypothetical protein